jgi:acyl dehydratase
MPLSAGRAYAALDGDISPMHLYKATAMLMGFPSPVANVHLLAARAEASIAAKKGESVSFAVSVFRGESTRLGSCKKVMAFPAFLPILMYR